MSFQRYTFFPIIFESSLRHSLLTWSGLKSLCGIFTWFEFFVNWLRPRKFCAESGLSFAVLDAPSQKSGMRGMSLTMASFEPMTCSTRPRSPSNGPLLILTHWWGYTGDSFMTELAFMTSVISAIGIMRRPLE